MCQAAGDEVRPKNPPKQAAIKFKRVLAYNIRQKLEADNT